MDNNGKQIYLPRVEASTLVWQAMRILDVCSGSKMFYFNKDNPNVLF